MNDRKRMILRAYKQNRAIAGKYWPKDTFIRIECWDALSDALQKLAATVEEAVKALDWRMITKNSI